MRYRSVCLIAIWGLFIVAGCAKAPVQLKRVMVVNATENRISDVKVLHLPTRKTGQVNMILPNKSLDIGFSGQPMKARKAIVSWQDSNLENHQAEVVLPYDSLSATEGHRMDLIYVIHSNGTVSVRLQKTTGS